MKPNISEFSYGYAITDELVHWHGIKITAAPFFPSLYREGQDGGGWDVMLDRVGIPLFLQFKLSDCMIRRTAYECVEGWFSPPFYRMHLRPTRFSSQHEMLLDLENGGNEVYYSAPAFHEPWELNHAYLNHDVKNSSIWVRPSWIGPLPDEWDHHVAFQQPGNKRFCSESFPIEDKADFESFSRNIAASIRMRGEYSLKEKYLYDIAERITDISSKRYDIPPEIYQATRQETKAWRAIDRIAFFSSMFLGAQLFIVSEDE